MGNETIVSRQLFFVQLQTLLFRHRERLFGVQRADLIEVAEKYMPLKDLDNKGVTTVFGAEEQENEIQSSGKWLVNVK